MNKYLKSVLEGLQTEALFDVWMDKGENMFRKFESLCLARLRFVHLSTGEEEGV